MPEQGTPAHATVLSKPLAGDTLPATIEQCRDLITASIAHRARLRYPNDPRARAAYFNAENWRHADRLRAAEARRRDLVG